MKINQITIIGLGLIGGSLGLALKDRDKNLKVIGVAKKTYQVEKAKAMGAIDEGFLDYIQGVVDSDLIIIATPVSTIKDIVLKIIPFLKPSCIITDTGSTKNEITTSLSFLSRKDVSFVGSHPIAGSHLSGIEVAKKDLFRYNPCIITPLPVTSSEALAVVKGFWELLEAKVVFLTPLEHDEIISSISHLPHILSSALVNIIVSLTKKFPYIPEIITPSFKDITRIAASNPYMWSDIVLSNREMLLESLSLFREKISYWEKIIKEQDKIKIEEEFMSSKKWKEEN
ncbi:MAG: prephenate dehydrogenase [bacterium]|nr:prephenate dehydrogenase [bacterium]